MPPTKTPRQALLTSSTREQSDQRNYTIDTQPTEQTTQKKRKQDKKKHPTATKQLKLHHLLGQSSQHNPAHECSQLQYTQPDNWRPTATQQGTLICTHTNPLQTDMLPSVAAQLWQIRRVTENTMADLHDDVTYEGWDKTSLSCRRECMGIL